MKPLFANPILPLLAIALADRAFQNYATFEEIEEIPPPADESLHHLRIKKDMLRVPFFRIVSIDEPTRKIQGAGSFSNRTKRRTVHLKGFRDLSLHHHPQLLQSLLAKVKADLDNCSEFIFVNKKIEMLRKKLRGIKTEDEAQPARARREELYWRKRQLVVEELSK
ncbi:MAG: hypothetical protein Q9191_006238 [Dirinaria sp. TL-2023a]